MSEHERKNGFHFGDPAPAAVLPLFGDAAAQRRDPYLLQGAGRADEGHRHCGFNGNVKLFIIVGSIIPADDNTGTDRCSGKEHDDHIDDAGG